MQLHKNVDCSTWNPKSKAE